MQEKKITRRDFLRIAGLASIAVPASRIGAPDSIVEKKDAIELADEAGRPQRPWWVREVEIPTVEIDWDIKKRVMAQSAVSPGGRNFADFVGEEQAAYIEEIAARNRGKNIQENVPGYSIQDYALYNALLSKTWNAGGFLGAQAAPTPEDIGIDKWKGTPSEGARLIRVAMRQFGAAQVGFLALNENTRKLIFSHDPDGKEIIFEDTHEAYETEIKRVIPIKAKWVVVYSVQMSLESFKRAPTKIAHQAVISAYSRAKYIQHHTQEFIRGLGYQCLGQDVLNSLGISLAFGVLAGLGELSRTNRLITPEYGPLIRTFIMLTDLPVMVDKPIDAGIMEFCKHCKKCAESCPAGALRFEDEPSWDVKGSWNSPGHKAYFEDAVKCYTYWKEVDSDCGICLAVCPFSKKDKAWIHQWVKAGVSVLPALDGFFRSMDDAFSYGAQKDPELWWHLDLPIFGVGT